MAYEPTHEVPERGVPAFAAPDPTPGPVARLDAGLDVQVLERRDDWAHIACSNGWEAWVDGRRLVERGLAPPPPSSQIVDTPVVSAPPAGAATVQRTAAGPGTAAPSPSAPTPPPGAPTPPPGAPPTGWVPPAARAQRSGLALGHGQIVALVGAGLVLLSGWLNWFEVEGGDSGSAYLVPAKLLIDNQITDDAGLNTGILVLLCAALVVAGALARQVPWLAVVGGGIAVVIALLFMFQVNGLASDFDVALFDFMGFAPLLTVLGGAAAVVGGVLVLSQPRRP